jgi:ribosomal protein S18 acetylase RimI-like enzyme
MGTIRQTAARVGMRVRQLTFDDRDAVARILEACGVFTGEEVRVALEVVDAGLSGGIDGDYPLFVVEMDGQVRGYVCVGKTPLTVSTWHLYWICVDPEVQGRGAGRALQSYAERFIRSRGGERLVLETSGQVSYERTRRFYIRAGYSEVSRIRDFYKPGDDCIVFCKELK